jgi:hypothetical protein
MSEYLSLEWLARALAGGGALLLAAWAAARWQRSPARRQRLAEWAVLSALVVAVLSLGPSWIGVRLPEPAAPAAPAAEPVAPVEGLAREPPEMVEPFFDGLELEPAPAEPPAVAHAVPDRAMTPAEDAPAGVAVDAGRLLLGGYAVVAGVFLGWWLLGHAVLWWWLRRREPIPVRLAALWGELSPGRNVRLVVSPRARVPFSCGVWRPTVVLPARLARAAPIAALRWVLAHELAHLDRHDPLGSVLFGVGGCLFFPLPWFWWLRREARLCQEYLADEAAVAAGGDRVGYAEFLVGWAQARVPAGVPSVAGTGTDLFRRVKMLLQEHERLEWGCPGRWSLGVASGLLALAVLLAGVGPARSVASADQKDPFVGADNQDKKAPPANKDEKPAKKEKDKAAKPKSVIDVEELLKRLPADLDEQTMKSVRQQLEQAQRQLEQALRQAEQWKEFRMPAGRWYFGSHGTRLGVQVSAPPAALAEQLDLPKGQGLVVDEVLRGTPAAKVGVRKNDVLLELDGKPIANKPAEIQKMVEGVKPGKAVDLVVLRRGKKETLRGLTLAEPRGRYNVRPWGQGTTSLTIQRTGDQFNLTQFEGGRTVTIRGKLVGGKAQPAEIRIAEAGRSNRYTSVDDVPAADREAVKALLEICEKGVAGAKSKK